LYLYLNFPEAAQGLRSAQCEVKLGENNMKYAIVEDGGKQYKAIEGSTIEVDHFPAEVGEPVDMKNVLLIVHDEEISVGKPFVTGAHVQAKVAAQEAQIDRFVQAKKRYRKNGSPAEIHFACRSNRLNRRKRPEEA
jgi:ribosomal protein L21